MTTFSAIKQKHDFISKNCCGSFLKKAGSFLLQYLVTLHGTMFKLIFA